MNFWVAMGDVVNIWGCYSNNQPKHLGKFQSHRSTASYLVRYGHADMSRWICEMCYIWPCISRCWTKVDVSWLFSVDDIPHAWHISSNTSLSPLECQVHQFEGMSNFAGTVDVGHAQFFKSKPESHLSS